MPTDFDRHRAVLRDVLIEGMSGTKERIDPKTFSAYSRVMREGLQLTAISVGGDSSIEDADKGKFMTVIALMNNALADAFELNAIRDNIAAQPTIKSLSR